QTKRYLMCSILCHVYSATTVNHTLSLHDALPISSSETSSAAAIRRVDICSDRLFAPEGSSSFDSRRLAVICPGSREIMASARFLDRKSTRLNSSHVKISYAVFCLKKKKQLYPRTT